MILIGLISGTSADGVDAALCHITGAPPRLTATVRAALTLPYPADLRRAVLAAGQGGTSAQVCDLNAAVADHFAEAAARVAAAVGLPLADVDLIGSHGQTVWHSIEADGRARASLQIGAGSIIAERTGVTTVSDFRPRDIAAGGQGAPLTAYLDWLLLRHPDHWRAAQNIGGIGNVTFLPPLHDSESAPLAFDTGPGNALIDAAVSYITGGAAGFDRDGAYALAGTVDRARLDRLLADPYLRREPPKSTGRELYTDAAAVAFVDAARADGLTDADAVATLTAFTAHSIADAYRRFAPAPVGEVILGGGGRLNPALVDHLRALLNPALVRDHDEFGIPGDHKEALVFALLAHETWHNRPGTLPALTGATHATVLGQIAPGTNYAALIRRTWCAS